MCPLRHSFRSWEKKIIKSIIDLQKKSRRNNTLSLWGHPNFSVPIIDCGPLVIDGRDEARSLTEAV